MGITGAHLTDDRAIVEYHLDKPYGIPDEDHRLEILFRDVESLPLLPVIEDPLVEGSYNNVQKMNLPDGRELAFYFRAFMEKCAGPSEEVFEGVYRNPQ